MESASVNRTKRKRPSSDHGHLPAPRQSVVQTACVGLHTTQQGLNLLTQSDRSRVRLVYGGHMLAFRQDLQLRLGGVLVHLV